MISLQLKIMVEVLPRWRFSPLTSSHISRFCGSLISSLVTSQGPMRAKGLAALALGPLPGALDLKHALGHIIGKTEARNHVERLVLADITRMLADDDAEFDFPVELGRALRDHGVVVRPADAGRRLVEDDRLFRDLHAGFGGVIGIVQPDGDEIADMADAGANARVAADRRQLSPASPCAACSAISAGESTRLRYQERFSTDRAACRPCRSCPAFRGPRRHSERVSWGFSPGDRYCTNVLVDFCLRMIFSENRFPLFGIMR